MSESKTGNSNWPRRAVVYHIYPRSFKDESSDGIGDLPGVISKLDYLKNLGAGAIWLSPFYKSPMADFGYDVSDYRAVDPIFGTMEDFDELVSQAHSRGIKVIVDFVPNHTSDQHPWFLESKASRENPKRNWYIWANGKSKPDAENISQQPEAPSNWLSVFGGSAWEWDAQTEQYYYHTFLKQQPDLNWHNPEVRKAMQEVLHFWLKKGVDGFRMDAVHWLIKDKQLRDDPPNPNFSERGTDPYQQFLHVYSHGQDETLKVLSEFCRVLLEYQDKFMVTELYADVATMAKYFRVCDENIHSPFNLNLIGLPWDVSAYAKFLNEFEQSLRPQDWPNYILGNHDQPRLASRLGQQKARVAALMQFTLRGMPFVYYGEEIGMENISVPPEMAQDPFEKNVPGVHLGRDPQRSPMQWDAGANAGFSSGKPWLPVNENYQHINVEAESKDTRSMLSLYRQLIALRNESAVLLEGDYRQADVKNPKVFAYSRSLGKQKILIVINFAETAETISTEPAQAEIVLTSYLDRPSGEKVSLQNFSLRPFEGYIFKQL